MQTDDIGSILTAVFALVTFIMFLIPALMTASRKRKLQAYLYETEAEVVAMDRRRFTVGRPDPGNPPLWVPTFRYYAGGQEFIHQSRVGTSKKIYEVGDRVAIKVDPYDPRKYVLTESYGFKIAVRILYAIAAAFAVFTVASVIIMNFIR